MRRSNAEIRAEGERHVMAELRRRGIPYRERPDRRRVDLLVGPMTDGVVLQVRVTSKGERQGWLLTDELEAVTDGNLFYAFVNTQPAQPETFVIPARVVSDALRSSHAAWLATPGLGGRQHRDNPMRMILMDYRFPVPGYRAGWLEAYRERWDLLQ